MPPPQLQARRGQLGGVDGRDSARIGGRVPPPGAAFSRLPWRWESDRVIGFLMPFCLRKNYLITTKR